MTQIAAQLFTIRDFTQTRDDFAASMAKIRAIGYEAVQVSQIGDIPDAEVKRIADDNGLTICNTHSSVDQLQRDPDAVIEQHRLWGARHVAIGGMPLKSTAKARTDSGVSPRSQMTSARGCTRPG